MQHYAAYNTPTWDDLQKRIENGDNHISIFHLGRYIDGYTVANHVLRLRSRVTVNLNLRLYIWRYTSPNENFEYSYPLNICIEDLTWVVIYLLAYWVNIHAFLSFADFFWDQTVCKIYQQTTLVSEELISFVVIWNNHKCKLMFIIRLV